MSHAPAETPTRLALTSGPAAQPSAHHRSSPPETPAAARAAVRPATGTPRLSAETTGNLAARVASPVTAVLGWVRAAAMVAGEPLSVTVTASTRDVHISVATADLFRAWAEYLRAGTVRRSTDALGTVAEVTVTNNGWALRVRLFGPACEELR